MKSLWRSLLGIILLLPVVLEAAEFQRIYTVSEITRVLSPVSFECRLKDYPGAGQVRFQVFLRDVEPSPDRPEAQSVKALEETLRSAKQIELNNVKVRNYFRLEAQVNADSRDVRTKLLPTYLQEQTKAVPEIENTNAAVVVPKRSFPTDSGPKRLKDLDLNTLLATKVDLSVLRSETPFSEALEILSNAMEPRAPFVVYWKDLENNANVDKDTPIGIEGFRVVSAAQALDMILYSVGSYGRPLKFTIQGGIVKIGTVASLSKKITQVYSVTDLVSPPAYETGDNSYTGASGSRYNKGF